MGRNINDVLKEERDKKLLSSDVDRALGITNDSNGKRIKFSPDFTYFNNARYDSTGPYSEYNDGKYIKFENTMAKHNLSSKNVSDEEASGIPVGATDSYGKKGLEALEYMLYKDEDPRGLQQDEEFQNLLRQQSQFGTTTANYTNDDKPVSPEGESGLTGDDKKLAENNAAQEAAAQKDIADNVEDENGVYRLSNIYV